MKAFHSTFLIFFGAVFLVLGFVFFFLHGANSKSIGGVVIAGSTLQIGIGFLVVRFMPGYLLGNCHGLDDK